MFRVLDVLRPEVGRTWHEVVAIVQEVAAQLGSGSSVPGGDDLLLDADGVLRFGFGPDTDENPVSGLGSLLKTLLEGVDAPVGLREIAEANARATPALSSVESFQRAVGFYERPGRVNELRAVADRLAEHASRPVPEQEFERLREKVSARAEDPKSHQEEPRRKISRKGLIAAAVLELVVLAAIVAYARPQYFRFGGFGDRVEQGLADTISTGLNKLPAGDLGPPVSVQAEAPAPDARPLDRGKKTTARAVSTAGLRPAASQRIPLLLPDGAQATSPSGAPTFVLSPVPAVNEPQTVGGRPAAGPAVRTASGNLTYTSADLEVQPPRLSRQQLPRQPEPGSDTGYFDVTVSASGDVEQLKLISPMQRFQERMLMAAAKAWTFKPATRYGQPVRYRMRIAIILPGQP